MSTLILYDFDFWFSFFFIFSFFFFLLDIFYSIFFFPFSLYFFYPIFPPPPSFLSSPSRLISSLFFLIPPLPPHFPIYIKVQTHFYIPFSLSQQSMAGQVNRRSRHIPRLTNHTIRTSQGSPSAQPSLQHNHGRGERGRCVKSSQVSDGVGLTGKGEQCV